MFSVKKLYAVLPKQINIIDLVKPFDGYVYVDEVLGLWNDREVINFRYYPEEISISQRAIVFLNRQIPVHQYCPWSGVFFDATIGQKVSSIFIERNTSTLLNGHKALLLSADNMPINQTLLRMLVDRFDGKMR